MFVFLVIDQNRNLNRNRNTEISVGFEPIPKPKPKDRAYRNRNRNRNRNYKTSYLSRDELFNSCLDRVLAAKSEFKLKLKPTPLILGNV